MAHRRYRNYGYNRTHRSGGPTFGPPGKSDAYYVDGGANDEGYYWTYCPSCDKKTEHDPCSGCCNCRS